jgi:hypothetical protein
MSRSARGYTRMVLAPSSIFRSIKENEDGEPSSQQWPLEGKFLEREELQNRKELSILHWQTCRLTLGITGRH